jgi:hypothetical protein
MSNRLTEIAAALIERTQFRRASRQLPQTRMAIPVVLDEVDYRKHGINLRLSASILNPGTGQTKPPLMVIDLSLTGADY